MVNSRNKGGTGERELADLLRAWSFMAGVLIDPERNLEQSRGGGHDLNGIPGLAVECKRVEVLNVTAWWAQTVRQAKAIDAIPFLAYRSNRKPWQFKIRVWVFPCKEPLDLDFDMVSAQQWFMAHMKKWKEDNGA